MLKKTALCLGLLLVAAFPCIAGAATPINSAGYYKNIKLCGKVKIVDSFPDIKVKVVDSFPDLKVKVVHMSCQKCWQLFFYAIFKVNALLKKYSLGVLYV